MEPESRNGEETPPEGRAQEFVHGATPGGVPGETAGVEGEDGSPHHGVGAPGGGRGVEGERDRTPAVGYVYLISDAASGLHKIGRSLDPAGRLIELGGKSLPLSLVHKIRCRCYWSAERYLHAAFRGERVHGEWFRLADGDVAAILSVSAVETDADWGDYIRERYVAGEGKGANPGVPVQLPAAWLALAKELAADRPMPVAWLLIELIRKDAETRGCKNLPLSPWQKRGGAT